MGLDDPTRAFAEESLEPGDRLQLFTDGVVEARSADGEFFGADRLADLVVRGNASGQPAPETMRRLVHAVLAHQEGQLQDDGTAMLVGWLTGDTERITPSTSTSRFPSCAQSGVGGEPEREAAAARVGRQGLEP